MIEGRAKRKREPRVSAFAARAASGKRSSKRSHPKTKTRKRPHT